VLQLATRWDSHISPELFRNTLLIARVLSVFYTANCYLAFRFHTKAELLSINLPKLFTLIFRSLILNAIFAVDSYDCVLASACLAHFV